MEVKNLKKLPRATSIFKRFQELIVQNILCTQCWIGLNLSQWHYKFYFPSFKHVENFSGMNREMKYEIYLTTWNHSFMFLNMNDFPVSRTDLVSIKSLFYSEYSLKDSPFFLTC